MTRNGTGTGRVYKRGNVWWIDYGFRGERHRESSGSTRKKDAVALLQRRHAEMGSGRLVGPDAERITLADLCEALIDDQLASRRRSVDRTRLSVEHLKAFFGAEARALDIGTDRINAYVRHRFEDGASPGTVRRELSALKRAFNLAVKAQRLPTRPDIPMPTVDNVRKGFFKAGDLEAVIDELPAYLRPVVRFSALTGWRKGEILSLTWAQVDFDAGEMRLEPGTTKNDEGRTFPFAALPPLAELLQEQRERTRALERERGEIIPWVFHREGNQILSMRTAWNGATRRAGLKGWLFHDLRRTAVRNLERAGVPRSVAMKLTGHTTEEVYRRYAIADSAALMEGVGKLARLHAGEDPAERSVLTMREKRSANR